MRTWYLDWYARCRALVNNVVKAALAEEYSGGGLNIHRYISNPAGTEYYTPPRMTARSSHSNRSYHRWKNKYDDNFQKPFNEQRLLLMRVRASVQVQEENPAPPPPPAIDTIRLHTRVRAVSSQLFKDGHYRQAIVQACLALNEAVQQRSGRSDIDGVALMQQVFSPKSPTLKYNGHPDEQLGYMWLFSGMWMAIRNPRSHKVGEAEDLDANEALELLAFISALFRALDSANRVDPS